MQYNIGDTVQLKDNWLSEHSRTATIIADNGDGYYTVEDTGPGAKGYSIDIYADDGETGNYSTCTRTVHVV